MPKGRREKGTGSVYYSSSAGTWQARIYVKGRYITRNGKTEAEAKRKLRELIKTQETVQSRAKGDGGSETFRTFADNWLVDVKKHILAPSSYENLSYDLKKYAYPVIGRIQLRLLTTDDVQALINKLLKDGRALSTIRRVKSAVSSCLSYAVEKHIVQNNVCGALVMPTKKAYPHLKKKPICVLTDEECQKYIERATCVYPNGTPMYRVGWGFVLVLATGMRREEIVALEWANVDMQKDLIRIDKVASFVPDDVDGKKHKTKIIEITKSDNSERYIPISASAKVALTNLKAVTGNFKYVLGTTENEPLGLSTVATMHARIMKGAGITRPDGVKTGMHCLRHTFCSHLIAHDPPLDIKTISEIMGHADTKITLDVYGHIFDERKSMAVSSTDFLNLKQK